MDKVWWQVYGNLLESAKVKLTACLRRREAGIGHSSCCCSSSSSSSNHSSSHNSSSLFPCRCELSPVMNQ